MPDSGFGHGVYAVALAADRLLAFDLDSSGTTPCARIDPRPFTLPHDSRRYYRFRCEARWDSRDVLFVGDRRLRPMKGEHLDWQPWSGDSTRLSVSPARRSAIHRYTMVAHPLLLNGLSLFATATFSGQYPPPKGIDELRRDSITFDDYRIRSRSLHVGRSAGASAQTWFEARESRDSESGLDWAFLPEDASHKTGARFTALYSTPGGYLIMLLHSTDHEGAGVDEVAELYSWEGGHWKARAIAKRTRMY